MLAEQIFVEKSCTEFHGNPRDDLVLTLGRTWTDGRTDGHGLSVRRAVLIYLKSLKIGMQCSRISAVFRHQESLCLHYVVSFT
jgi:hypothetical protein